MRKNRSKITNFDVDLILIDRNIKRLGNYSGMMKKLRFLCMHPNCAHKWKAIANNVLNCEKGCPVCAGYIKWTNEIVDKELIGTNIKRLGNCKGAKIKIRFQCMVENCLYKWKTAPKNIINSKSGCPQCEDQIKLTNKIIDKRLKDKNIPIKRISDCSDGGGQKIKFLCLIDSCKNIWSAKSASILKKNGAGCPKCNTGKNEKLVSICLDKFGITYTKQYRIYDINCNGRGYISIDYCIDVNNKKYFIEYNGAQHYIFCPWFHKTENGFVKQQKRDLFVKEWCNKNNVSLLSIDGRKYKNTSLEKYLIEEIISVISLAQNSPSLSPPS